MPSDDEKIPTNTETNVVRMPSRGIYENDQLSIDDVVKIIHSRIEERYNRLEQRIRILEKLGWPDREEPPSLEDLLRCGLIKHWP